MQISLKAARVNAGYTQKEVAKRINTDVSTVIKWENGKTYPTANKLAELCALYECCINDIFLLKKSG